MAVTSVVVSRRSGGGFTVNVNNEGDRFYSELKYGSAGTGIKVIPPINQQLHIPVTYETPSVYTVDGVTGFTTIEQVADALDTLGVGKITIGDVVGSQAHFSGTPLRVKGTFTRPANTTDYAANDAMGPFAAAVKMKETFTLTGTNGTANITVAGVTKAATFATDLTTTAANFVTAWAADYLAAGVVLTSSGADLIFEAAVAGVPFTFSSTISGTGDLSVIITHTTANVTLIPITFTNVAAANGAGGYISDAICATDAVQFASKDVVIALFKTSPAGIVGDNVAYVDDFSNSDNYVGEITVSIGAALGSAMVKGKTEAFTEFLCAAGSRNLYGLMRVTGAVVTPKSGGVFNWYLNILQL